MRKLTAAILLLLISCIGLAQSFEGTFVVTYKNDKGVISKAEIKVKDQQLRIKNIVGGVAKYDCYLLNLATHDFYTVSTADKKVAIKYNADKLLALYDQNQLKENFRVKPELSYKPTEKIKEENSLKLTKYTGENDFIKGSFWSSNYNFNFCSIIPLLRLTGFWNNIQAENGIITSGEEFNKVAKTESTVNVTIQKETIGDDTFKVPANYLQKDFAKIMEQEKGNKDLNLIVQTFAGF